MTGIAGDVGSAAEVNRLLAKLGPVDILINNAGIFEPKPFADIPDSEWLRFFEVNVMSGIRLSRALLPHMLKKKWGRIIFISSESGLNIPAEMVHYGMTKTAQLADLARHCRDHSGNGRDGQRRAARPDADRRRECVSSRAWPRSGASAWRRWRTR